MSSMEKHTDRMTSPCRSAAAADLCCSNQWLLKLQMQQPFSGSFIKTKNSKDCRGKRKVNGLHTYYQNIRQPKKISLQRLTSYWSRFKVKVNLMYALHFGYLKKNVLLSNNNLKVTRHSKQSAVVWWKSMIFFL